MVRYKKLMEPSTCQFRCTEVEPEPHRKSWLPWRVQLMGTSPKTARARVITPTCLFPTKTIRAAQSANSKEISKESPLCFGWNWKSSKISTRILPTSYEFKSSNCNRKPIKILNSSNECQFFMATFSSTWLKLLFKKIIKKVIIYP